MNSLCGFFIGKVLEFTENWIKVEGKGIVIVYGQVNPVDIDDELRVMLVPKGKYRSHKVAS